MNNPSRPIARRLVILRRQLTLGFGVVILAAAAPGAQAEPAPAEASPFDARAMIGVGYADLQSRHDDSTSFFAQAGATLSAGYAPWRRGGLRLIVSAELLLSRSLQSSPESRAAGNLSGLGPTVTLSADGLGEFGLGVLLVARNQEARALGLTKNQFNAGIEGFLAKHWPVSDHLAVGLTAKVVMLPTGESRDENGGTVVHYSEGIGLFALSASLR